MITFTTLRCDREWMPDQENICNGALQSAPTTNLDFGSFKPVTALDLCCCRSSGTPNLHYEIHHLSFLSVNQPEQGTEEEQEQMSVLQHV